MRSLQKCHTELDENGEGNCSVPIWRIGYSPNFCNQKAYGFRIHEDYFCCPGLACPEHGGPGKPIN